MNTGRCSTRSWPLPPPPWAWVGALAVGRLWLGELLYDTHCRACHTEQVHWRDKRAATDWPGLKEEVRRWQAADRLGWSEADVVAVARYLNETVYHLPQTGDGIGSLTPAEPALRVARVSR